MRRSSLFAIGILAAALPGVTFAQSKPAGNRDHGQYLAERVAMCVQCHSPRDVNGNLIASDLFMGAPVPVSAPTWLTEWALRAPRIAGTPGYNEADFVRLLTQGTPRAGQPPIRRPMPPFRMSEQDAKDLYSYLSTLR
jgi:hypothetical protein